jgi:uncharacterized membrane protein
MKETKKGKVLSAKTITLAAMLIAITTALTLIVRIPFAPTRGYIALADVSIFFTAFAFGGIPAFVAGAFGTAIADIIGGYPHWCLFSFVIHGAQGLLAGIIAHKGTLPKMLIAGVLGVLVMAAGYFAAAAVMYGVGPALIDAPGNVIQAGVGVIAGIPLYKIIRKAYPPLDNLFEKQKWVEAE